MLDSDSLAQLKQLKQAIHDSKDYGQGTVRGSNVRGSNNRHGFVSLDDGREAYLSPELMQQLLPGDRVEVTLTKNENKKWQAKLEKLLSTTLKECVGTYFIKDNNHFVIIDHPEMNRWLFVPPKSRQLKGKPLQHGDFVISRISRHPYGHGKGQVKILKCLGNREDTGIERRYVIAKNRLHTDWNKHQQEQTQAILAKNLAELNADDPIVAHREDLTAIPFVTIDAESTLDMDDAVFAEQCADHWRLCVAIADPSSLIAAESPLDIEARRRAASTYFPGYCIPMLPNELAQQYFSLQAGGLHLALVCETTINFDGDIVAFAFKEALVSSRQKLSYLKTSEFLKNDTELFSDETAAEVDGQAIRDSIRTLAAIAEARKNFRQQHHLLQDDNTDFYLKLDKQQHIESFEKRDLSPAHVIVEEAMLTANICAGQFLAEQGHAALFATHKGFRSERLNDIQKLLKNNKPDFEFEDLLGLEDFRRLFRRLIADGENDEEDNVLLAVLRRLLQPGEITLRAQPHFGLGLDRYALITSPIRRYTDLHNHRVIRSLLRNDTSPAIQESWIATLQEQMQINRQAIKELERWLYCIYLKNQVGHTFDATINAVSNQGLGVRLSETGIDSFIPMRNTKEKPLKFNSQSMRLQLDDETYHLEKPVKVKLRHVDLGRKQMSFVIENHPQTETTN